LTFPATILPSSLQKDLPTKVNEFGWVELQDENILEKIPIDIPVLLFFHMGGMVFGTPNTADILYFYNRALASLDDPLKKPMILASINIRTPSDPVSTWVPGNSDFKFNFFQIRACISHLHPVTKFLHSIYFL
jgi:hypothetical protein